MELWTPDDFPAEAPAEYRLSHVQYRHFRAIFLGKPALKCWLTAEQLESEGCASWKEYLFHLSLGNYG